MTNAPNRPESFRRLVREFEEMEWRFECDTERPLIRTGFRGSNGTGCRILAWIDESDSLLQVHARYAVEVPPRLRRAVAEMICRATYGLKEGGFFMDMNDGEVGFHISARYVGHDLPVETVKHSIRTAIALVDGYWPCFEACIFQGMEPEVAVAKFDPIESKGGRLRRSPEHLRRALAAEFGLEGDKDQGADSRTA